MIACQSVNRKMYNFQHQNNFVFKRKSHRMITKLKIKIKDDCSGFGNEDQTQITINQRRTLSPIPKSPNKNNFLKELTCCGTPQSIQCTKQAFEFKSPKYVGIIEKNVLQRLQYYKQKQKGEKYSYASTKIKKQQQQLSQLKQKPEINQVSKELFQKRKKQRKLSPNVLDRFQTYQCQKVSRAAKNQLIKTYNADLKNTMSTCKKMTHQKTRTPLKQQNTKNKPHRSHSSNQLLRKLKNPAEIGKIVQRKKIQDNKQIERFGLSPKNPNQMYYSMVPNENSHYSRERFFTEEDFFPPETHKQKYSYKLF